MHRDRVIAKTDQVDTIEKLFPRLRNKIDPEVEKEFFLSFHRVYEYFENRLRVLKADYEAQIAAAVKKMQDQISSTSVGVFPLPLAGAEQNQSLNTVVVAPVANQPASQLDANGTILDVNNLVDGQFLRRTGATIVSGVPAGTTTLGEGYLSLAETILYTVPVGAFTLIKKIAIINTTAAPLIATFYVRNAASGLVFTDDYPLLANEELIITFNQTLSANWTLRGNADSGLVINYLIFGIEETL